MDKSEIRKRIRERRAKLSANDIEALSQEIVNRLVNYTDWKTIRHLHAYVTIQKLNEADTRPFLEFIQQAHPSIKIYHPEDEPAELDLVIVPLLAFDESCNRIGHGGGYYDRFLKKYPQVQKIGLAFELQKVKEVSIETHDVQLDAIITESHIYTAKI